MYARAHAAFPPMRGRAVTLTHCLVQSVCTEKKKRPRRSRTAAADSETCAQHYQRLKDRSVAASEGDLGARSII